MSDTKKTSHTIGKIKKLIDLNGDNTNFDLSFTATCQDDTPFHLLVVDQTTLDNTPELQYKEVNGTISGNIVADKNIYQNYFLILKSEKTCNVDVELTLKALPKTPDSAMGMNEGIAMPPPQQGPSRAVRKPVDTPINWKKIGLIALVVVIGIAVLWWLYKRKGSSSNPESKDSYEEPNLSFNNTMPAYDPTPVKTSPARPVPKSKASPEMSSTGDSRGYKPGKSGYRSTTLSPDVMSQASGRSSEGGDGGNSLLYRLRKFAR